MTMNFGRERKNLDSYICFSISYIASRRPNTNKNVAYILDVIKEKGIQKADTELCTNNP